MKEEKTELERKRREGSSSEKETRTVGRKLRNKKEKPRGVNRKKQQSGQTKNKG